MLTKGQALPALHRLRRLPQLVQDFFQDPTCVTSRLSSPLTYRSYAVIERRAE
jgi:hypothetical protein